MARRYYAADWPPQNGGYARYKPPARIENGAQYRRRLSSDDSGNGYLRNGEKLSAKRNYDGDRNRREMDRELEDKLEEFLEYDSRGDVVDPYRKVKEEKIHRKWRVVNAEYYQEPPDEYFEYVPRQDDRGIPYQLEPYPLPPQPQPLPQPWPYYEAYEYARPRQYYPAARPYPNPTGYSRWAPW